jgi:hypothetical protein
MPLPDFGKKKNPPATSQGDGFDCKYYFYIVFYIVKSCSLRVIFFSFYFSLFHSNYHEKVLFSYVNSLEEKCR